MFEELKSKIKTYEWTDIEGKVLKIITAKDNNYIVIAGQDLETKEVYVIASQFVNKSQ